jgi:hypothetical protein
MPKLNKDLKSFEIFLFAVIWRQEDIVLRFQAFCGFSSIINVLWFLKIFRYLDNIVMHKAQ